MPHSSNLFSSTGRRSRPVRAVSRTSPPSVRPSLSVCLAPSSSHLCALCVRRLPRPGRGGENSPSFRSSLIRSSSPRLCALCALCVENSSSFCPSEPLRAVDSSRFELTLNLQLSTFNRVSFLSPSSPRLCALCVLCSENSRSFRSFLIARHSPPTTNSFTIRTSMTPLSQLLYNPHLQAPLGSAGNKGLITPLESALTKTWGVGCIKAHHESSSSFPHFCYACTGRLFHDQNLSRSRHRNRPGSREDPDRGIFPAGGHPLQGR